MTKFVLKLEAVNEDGSVVVSSQQEFEFGWTSEDAEEVDMAPLTDFGDEALEEYMQNEISNAVEDCTDDLVLELLDKMKAHFEAN